MLEANLKLGIFGLGYVGLPLSIEFAKKFKVYGYDVCVNRTKQLRKNIDTSNEIKINELKKVKKDNLQKFKKGLIITNKIVDLKNCNFYIVTVPTPINQKNEPDLSHLIKASKDISQIIKRGDIIVYESTVYPGATEEICLPILEKESKMKLNKDFFLGYSPERLNIGDAKRSITKVKKIVSGSNKKSAKFIKNVYDKIINAGVYLAPSIKIAEAAKIIENTQRLVNIAYINEIAKMFSLLKIDTQSVLKVASTKWNFHNYKPGLVGGHCIGVDPYYLLKKFRDYGYNSKLIESSLNINNSMGIFVADQVIKELLSRNIKINSAKVLILGITFKENCSDIRNTKVIDIPKRLKEFGFQAYIYDPLANRDNVRVKYNIQLLKSLENKKFDAIILAVAHNVFKKINLAELKNPNAIVFDVKGFLNEYTLRL